MGLRCQVQPSCDVVLEFAAATAQSSNVLRHVLRTAYPGRISTRELKVNQVLVLVRIGKLEITDQAIVYLVRQEITDNAARLFAQAIFASILGIGAVVDGSKIMTGSWLIRFR